MKSKLIDMELIDQYLKGQMNEDERREICKRMIEDEDFRELFDDMEIMAEGIRKSAAETSLEEKLAKLKENIYLEPELYESLNGNQSKEKDPAVPDKKSPGEDNTFVLRFPVADILYRYKTAIAASVSLVVIAWFVLTNPFGTYTGPELFAEYFTPYPNAIGMKRGFDQEETNERYEAYKAYDGKRFADAVVIFNRIIPYSDNKTVDQFYLGNAHLALGNTDEAIKAFTIVAEAKSGLALESKWYLGLSYLQKNDLTKAKEVFSELAELGEEQAEEAKKILNKLD